MIHVIIVGACGRMGKILTQHIKQQTDIRIVGAITSQDHPMLGQDVGEIAGVGPIGIPISNNLSEIVESGDLVIDFTSSKATIEHLKDVVDASKPMVIGTTGFNDEELAEVKQIAKSIPCVMAPNMSLCVNVLFQVMPIIVKALGEDYDIEVIEAHHRTKVDAPSGTAQRLAELIADTLEFELSSVSVYGRHDNSHVRPKQEIGIHTVRGGDLIGEHTVLFAGTGERIEITHRAQNRQAFAIGTLRAARWVVNAPIGLYDFSDVILSQNKWDSI